MAEIKISQQLLFALKNCKEAKSALEVLKNAGYDVTEEEADSFFQSLKNRKLTDEELKMIVGGTNVQWLTETLGQNSGERLRVQIYSLDSANYVAQNGRSMMKVQ